ncbi:MAG: hypothetical protein NUV42_00050 [Candidatus Yonathbacteria bacterium]|nr:hypothetical protein [Candidatus Yonathbacteria bacterium]
MSVENLLHSIVGNYLHFNRVDSYTDFPDADSHDGQQLPRDEQGNARITFKNAPAFSAADYYNRSRDRTYACCFSLENSHFIWDTYANGSVKGKVCIVFDFDRLRERLNQTLRPGNAVLEYDGILCHQIFSVNYGIVEYIDWNTHQINTERLPNPIKYTYLKDEKKFFKEKELRISLSALGIGQFGQVQFLPSLQLSFDFKSAIADHTIQHVQYAPDTDPDYLRSELQSLRIVPSKG